MRNNGFKNERDFVNFFNKKYLYEFDINVIIETDRNVNVKS